jgi:hypothetical protein
MAAVMFSIACQDQKPDAAANEEKPTADEVQKDTANAGKLLTRLRPGNGTFTTDSVPVHFTVVNEAATAQRFCKWETPLLMVLWRVG